ncbi:hypothetical protein SISSUDRAFT_1066883 [Sistotremastrum suecicum HHB10207 ss-3]|uniref:F-box domain-containing protein n=1 Tax=Sistotremastrum suecicum HHB10207 ss-3 TaxID=1314776 RepID=A0A165XSP1_9AGAM|nr:hypothetical protein SISSUDRAFT_1066883 [Sistotremastrum suecicum HHB10207 ss-3]
MSLSEHPFGSNPYMSESIQPVEMLPVELLQIIFDFTYAGSVSSAASLVRVCRKFNDALGNRLYISVTLREHQFHLFFRNITPGRREAVQRLAIVPESFSFEEESHVFFLSQFPNVRSLALSSFIWLPSHRLVESLLPMHLRIHLEPYPSLKHHYPEYWVGPSVIGLHAVGRSLTIEKLEICKARFPSVEYLRIDISTLEIPCSQTELEKLFGSFISSDTVVELHVHPRLQSLRCPMDSFTDDVVRALHCWDCPKVRIFLERSSIDMAVAEDWWEDLERNPRCRVI